MAGELSETVRRTLDALVSRDEEIAHQLADPAVASDHRAVRALAIERAAIGPAVEGYRRVRAIDRELDELRAASDDPELAALAREEIPRLESERAEVLARVTSGLVHADDRRVGSVILELRAGTGGAEAALWARDLLEMYRRFASRRGWSLEVLELTEDDEAGGVRSAVASVRGEGVWSELLFEAGVHQVKRVPATESQGRVHTSTATVAVLPEPEEVDVQIDWGADVVEHLTTAQGPGGQNVNKVTTACHLVHKPTGIEVRMQESKSLQQNREKARRLLVARVYELERQRQHAARAAERRDQIGTGQRSEKIRTYRYKDGIVADDRLPGQYALRDVMGGQLGPIVEALIEQETARRLAAL